MKNSVNNSTLSGLVISGGEGFFSPRIVIRGNYPFRDLIPPGFSVDSCSTILCKTKSSIGITINQNVPKKRQYRQV